MLNLKLSCQIEIDEGLFGAHKIWVNHVWGSIENKNCTASSIGPLKRGIGKKILILMELKDSEFMPYIVVSILRKFLNNIFFYIKRDKIQIQ